jgi:hypothetical protein
VGDFPGIRSLIAASCGGYLSAANHLPTWTAAIALSAITAPANSEQGVAAGILAPAESETLFGIVGTHRAGGPLDRFARAREPDARGKPLAEDPDILVKGEWPIIGANVTTFWIFAATRRVLKLAPTVTVHDLVFQNARTNGRTLRCSGDVRDGRDGRDGNDRIVPVRRQAIHTVS